MASLVLIHGAGDSSAVWEKQTAYFSTSHQVLAVDLPGHGARVPKPGMDRHEKNAQEVCWIMDQQGISKAVIAGHSMGGAVALTMALEHPERLQGLVLVATGARMKMRPDFLEEARKSAETYGSAVPAATHIIPVEQMVHPAIPADAVEWLKDRIGKASAQATYADFQANNNFDVMNRLGEVRVPTLVIGGSEDRMAPRKFAEFLANAIPGARLEILDPCGHYPQVEQEQAFNRAVESFLAEIS
jgi:pimeloyl-ACP methyl ester carboxylesterase